MRHRALAAWVVKAGDLVLFHGRVVPVVGARMVGQGHRRKRRILYRAPDGKIIYEDFGPSVILTVVVIGDK